MKVNDILRRIKRIHFQETYYKINAANKLDNLDKMDRFLERNRLLKLIQEETKSEQVYNE